MKDRTRDMLGALALQPASTAPLAAGLPFVQGRCPACGRVSLFLGNGGYVTCSVIDCPNPSLADEQLHGEQPVEAATDTATVARVQRLLNTGPIGTCCAHLVRAALGPAKQAAPPPGPCPSCRRADQAGLADSEQHPQCAGEQQPRAAVAPTRVPEIDRSLAARPGGDEGAVMPGPVLEGW